MAKSAKKVDVKKVEKLKVSAEIMEYLEEQGLSVSEGTNYGFTEGTLVLHTDKTDVQIKFITPKAGITKYEELPSDEEEVKEEEVKEDTSKEEIPKDEEKA